MQRKRRVQKGWDREVRMEEGEKVRERVLLGRMEAREYVLDYYGSRQVRGRREGIFVMISNEFVFSLAPLEPTEGPPLTLPVPEGAMTGPADTTQFIWLQTFDQRNGQIE